MRPNSLVSVGKLADADYTTVFHPRNESVTVHKGNSLKLHFLHNLVLQGWRDEKGLWRLLSETKPLICLSRNKNQHETAVNVYTLPLIPQTIQYLHAAAGFPVKDTWVEAIKHGNYSTWPGVDVKAVKKYFPESVETQKGHLKKQRQNVRSTKQKVVVNETPKGN